MESLTSMLGEFNGVFSIESLEMIEGDLPSRSQKLVKEWASQYKNELLRMWQKNEFMQLPGLDDRPKNFIGSTFGR